MKTLKIFISWPVLMLAEHTVHLMLQDMLMMYINRSHSRDLNSSNYFGAVVLLLLFNAGVAVVLSFSNCLRALTLALKDQINTVSVARQQTNVSMDLSIPRQAVVNGGTSIAISFSSFLNQSAKCFANMVL